MPPYIADIMIVLFSPDARLLKETTSEGLTPSWAFAMTKLTQPLLNSTKTTPAIATIMGIDQCVVPTNTHTIPKKRKRN
jgi:hypothetical protein